MIHRRNGASPFLCSPLQFTLNINPPVKFSSCNLLCFAGERADSGKCWMGLLAARQCSSLSSPCLSWSHGSPHTNLLLSLAPLWPRPQPPMARTRPLMARARSEAPTELTRPREAQPLLAPIGLGSFSQLVLLRLGKQSC